MIRSFFKFLLSRSFDDGTTATGWLRRLLVRDDQLNRFDTETQELDSLLRRAAAERRQSMAIDDHCAEVLTFSPQRPAQRTAAHTRKSGYSFAWLSGLAAAAIVFIAWSPNGFRPDAPAVHAGEFSQQLMVVPGKVLRLLMHAAKASQTQLPQLSPLANLTLPVLPAWEEVALRVESPVRDEIGIWQESWQNIKSQLPVDTKERNRSRISTGACNSKESGTNFRRQPSHPI